MCPVCDWTRVRMRFVRLAEPNIPRVRVPLWRCLICDLQWTDSAADEIVHAAMLAERTEFGAGSRPQG